MKKLIYIAMFAILYFVITMLIASVLWDTGLESLTTIRIAQLGNLIASSIVVRYLYNHMVKEQITTYEAFVLAVFTAMLFKVGVNFNAEDFSILLILANIVIGINIFKGVRR